MAGLRRNPVTAVNLARGGGAPLVVPSVSGAAWRKSSHSNPSGDCVEFAKLPGRRVAVRDSRFRGGGVLMFTVEEWQAFLAGVRAGDVG